MLLNAMLRFILFFRANLVKAVLVIALFMIGKWFRANTRFAPTGIAAKIHPAVGISFLGWSISRRFGSGVHLSGPELPDSCIKMSLWARPEAR